MAAVVNVDVLSLLGVDRSGPAGVVVGGSCAVEDLPRHQIRVHLFDTLREAKAVHAAMTTPSRNDIAVASGVTAHGSACVLVELAIDVPARTTSADGVFVHDHRISMRLSPLSPPTVESQPDGVVIEHDGETVFEWRDGRRTMLANLMNTSSYSKRPYRAYLTEEGSKRLYGSSRPGKALNRDFISLDKAKGCIVEWQASLAAKPPYDEPVVKPYVRPDDYKPIIYGAGELSFQVDKTCPYRQHRIKVIKDAFRYGFSARARGDKRTKPNWADLEGNGGDAWYAGWDHADDLTTGKVRLLTWRELEAREAS